MLSVGIAATYFTAFVWGTTSDVQLIVHLATIFIISLLFGTILIDTRKALLYAIGSIAMGGALAIAIITVPSLILSEAVELVDTTVTVALVAVARLFLLGVTFLVLGVMVGSFVGDALIE